jgi:hypothetical protein
MEEPICSAFSFGLSTLADMKTTKAYALIADGIILVFRFLGK